MDRFVIGTPDYWPSRSNSEASSLEQPMAHEVASETPCPAPRVERRRVKVEDNGPNTEVLDDFDHAVWPGLCHQAYSMGVWPKSSFRPKSKFLDLNAAYDDKYIFAALRDGVRDVWLELHRRHPVTYINAIAYWTLREERPTEEPSSSGGLEITKIFDLIIKYEDHSGAKRKHIFTTVERKEPVQMHHLPLLEARARQDERAKLKAVTDEHFAAAESSLAKAQETIRVMNRQMAKYLGNTETNLRGHDAISGAESEQ